MSATSQFYSYVATPSGLVKYIQEEICKPSSAVCKQAAASLLSSSYIDIDYDAISHALVLNAFWGKASDSATWTETIILPNQQEAIEVGVLNHEPNPDPEDIGFAGFLTVVGQDTKPSTFSYFLSLPLLPPCP